MSRVRVKWRGDDVFKRVLEATEDGINIIMGRAVMEAKQNHPGWQNRTATAEGSIRVQQDAQARGHSIAGEWGSVAVAYMGVLEFNHGSALRNAADTTYPGLADAIRSRL